MNYLRTYIDTQKINPFIEEHSTLPVYIHVPKCGGTYTLAVIEELLRMFSFLKYKSKPRLNLITFNIRTTPALGPSVKIFATDRLKLEKPYSAITTYDVELAEFLKLYAGGDISVFAAACTSRLLSEQTQEAFLNILELINKAPVFFTTLRTPYSRVMSMYYVHKKKRSRLASLNSRTTEGTLEEFSNFITSHDSEPGWLQEYLAYVFQKFDKSALLTFCAGHLHAAHTKDSFQHVKKIFLNVYGKKLANYLDFLPPDTIFKNSGIKNKIFHPESLTAATLERFKYMHAIDTELIKTALPSLEYDSTDTCESFEYLF